MTRVLNKIIMTQTDRNELFDFFHKKHDLLLTSDEITEIIEKTTKKDDNHYKKMMAYKINMYRFINVFLLGILNIAIPEKGMTYIVWIYIAYNLVHLIINIVKDKMDAIKEYRMARKQ